MFRYFNVATDQLFSHSAYGFSTEQQVPLYPEKTLSRPTLLCGVLLPVSLQVNRS